MAAVQVQNYGIQFYGSPDGFQGKHRVQVHLVDTTGKTAAILRFSDPGMSFETDSKDGYGIVWMHFPSGMFASVLDVLRNEKPIYVGYEPGRAFLTTSFEPAGEGD